MTLTDEQIDEFRKLTTQAMAWMSDNCHHHTTIIITSENAELFEGYCSMLKPSEAANDTRAN